MMHQAVCECGQFDCPADHGAFYASIRRNGEYRLLLGPFTTHEAALQAAPLAEKLANDTDPRACWYAYGTARTDHARQPLFIPCLECGEIHYYRSNHAHQQKEAA